MGKHKKSEEEKEEEDSQETVSFFCLVHFQFLMWNFHWKSTVVADNTPTYEDLVKLVGPIASPLASKKLTRRLLKVS